MHILAIETTDRSGSVAALDDDRVVAEIDLDPTMRSAQSLAPGIASLLEHVGWNPREIRLVAVATGPGSFTGLRVGVTTAKLIAYATDAQVQGVNSLEAIAWQAPPEVGDVWAVIDAQREQLFAGHFLRAASGVWQSTGEIQLIDNAAWLNLLLPGQSLSGPAVAKFLGKLPAEVRQVDQSLWAPKAAAVGRLAWRQYQSGARDDVFSLVPKYYRRSAAEEKRALSG
jgi:tRNA threonylcarbamoyladenosine biosynthesis protein TsaB